MHGKEEISEDQLVAFDEAWQYYLEECYIPEGEYDDRF